MALVALTETDFQVNTCVYTDGNIDLIMVIICQTGTVVSLLIWLEKTGKNLEGPAEEKPMEMSGRALSPCSITGVRELGSEEFCSPFPFM